MTDVVSDGQFKLDGAETSDVSLVATGWSVGSSQQVILDRMTTIELVEATIRRGVRVDRLRESFIVTKGSATPDVPFSVFYIVRSDINATVAISEFSAVAGERTSGALLDLGSDCPHPIQSITLTNVDVDGFNNVIHTSARVVLLGKLFFVCV